MRDADLPTMREMSDAMHMQTAYRYLTQEDWRILMHQHIMTRHRYEQADILDAARMLVLTIKRRRR